MSSDGGDRRSQADHVQEFSLGGSDGPGRKPRPKRVYLRMVEAPAAFEPRPGLPAGGRDECRSGERPCPYVRCEWHLWRVDAEDRQGRRWAGKKPTTTLEPRWLEYPTPACCGLDIAEATEQHRRVASGYVMPVSVIGEAMGRSSSSVWLLIKRALEKLEQRRDVQEMADSDEDGRVMAEGCSRTEARLTKL